MPEACTYSRIPPPGCTVRSTRLASYDTHCPPSALRPTPALPPRQSEPPICGGLCRMVAATIMGLFHAQAHPLIHSSRFPLWLSAPLFTVGLTVHPLRSFTLPSIHVRQASPTSSCMYHATVCFSPPATPYWLFLHARLAAAADSAFTELTTATREGFHRPRSSSNFISLLFFFWLYCRRASIACLLCRHACARNTSFFLTVHISTAVSTTTLHAPSIRPLLDTRSYEPSHAVCTAPTVHPLEPLCLYWTPNHSAA